MEKNLPYITKKLEIDIPGHGIAFIVPISSVGGKSQLQFLLGEQTLEVKEESILQNTKYELLVVVANIGYSNVVMDAARRANAKGGTVIHAKGTGTSAAETFLGITLASEREVIYIVVKTENKNKVMKAIMEEAGLNSEAQSIVFSLPVTSTLGMSFEDFLEQNKDDKIS